MGNVFKTPSTINIIQDGKVGFISFHLYPHHHKKIIIDSYVQTELGHRAQQPIKKHNRAE